MSETTRQMVQPAEIRIPVREPYDWRHLLSFLAPRATPGIERVEDGVYSRVVDLDGRTKTLRVRHDPGKGSILVGIPPARSGDASALVSRLRKMFDADRDPVVLDAVLSRDDLLAGVWRGHRGIRVPGCWDPFELSVRAILGQQVSVVGATTIAGRLVARWGRGIESDDPSLDRIFPAADVLADAPLEEIGLTRARASTVRELSRRVANGEIDLEDVERTVEDFLAVPGIGDWTSSYIAMRAHGQADAFPATDLGLRKAAGGISATALRRIAEHWRPWRAYAAMLLWAKLAER